MLLGELGKLFPHTSFVWCCTCSHLSGRPAAEDQGLAVTRHHCGQPWDRALHPASLQALTTSFWDAERHLHCKGSQCSEHACSKGCTGRAIRDGQAGLGDTRDRGQLLSISAQLPTLHRTSDYHLVQRKTTCTSKHISRFLLALERGKLHPKSLHQQCWVQESEAVRGPKAGAQACAPQPSGHRLGTLLHRSQGGRGYIGCKC